MGVISIPCEKPSGLHPQYLALVTVLEFLIFFGRLYRIFAIVHPPSAEEGVLRLRDHILRRFRSHAPLWIQVDGCGRIVDDPFPMHLNTDGVVAHASHLSLLQDAFVFGVDCPTPIPYDDGRVGQLNVSLAISANRCKSA